MRSFDKDGLVLCSLQGNVFASSLGACETSSEIFIRRFMLSDVATEFDSCAVLNDSLTINDIFQKIEDEFGKSTYGKIKYNKEVLYWIGYIYRYFSYTYNLTSKSIYKIIKPKELNILYYSYHSLDPAQAIERILEEKNLNFNYDKQNAQLLKLMQRKRYEKYITMIKNSSLNEDTGILMTIKYKDKDVGELRLNEYNDAYYQLEIAINDNYSTKLELEKQVLIKAMNLAKKEYNIKALITQISKNDETKIQLYTELGFSFFNEQDDIVYFIMPLNKKRKLI